MQINRTCKRCALTFRCEKPPRGAPRSICDPCRPLVDAENLEREYARRSAAYVPVPRKRPLCECGRPVIERSARQQGGGLPFKRCETCHRDRLRLKEWRRRLRRHGLTEERYSEILAGQGGTCAMSGCALTDDGSGRSLHVDHDHACCPGEYSCGACVRGFLCARHNVGIGYFANDPTALRAAADYLESRRAQLKAVV